MVTCQNPSCEKTFTKALKTLNLQQNPTQTYLACPFCLSEIENNTSPQEILIEEPQPNVNEPENKRNFEKQPGCHYYLGYLNERSAKGQFPDDCLVCQNVMECMTKKPEKH